MPFVVPQVSSWSGLRRFVSCTAALAARLPLPVVLLYAAGAAQPAELRGQNKSVQISAIAISLLENGNTYNQMVRLESAPTGDVNVAIVSADTTVATVDTANLTFTTSNWSDQQSVIITSVDDELRNDPDRSTRVTFTATGGGYDGNSKTATVTVADDEPRQAVIRVWDSSIVVNEDGTYPLPVWLGGIPTGDITIQIVSDDTTVAAVTPSTLTFTPSTWNDRQTVTVSGIDDDVYNSTLRTTRLAFSASGPEYENVTQSASVYLFDNEPDTFSLNEGESVARTVNRNLRYNCSPVTMTVSSGDTSVITVNPTMFSWTHATAGVEMPLTLNVLENELVGDIRVLISRDVYESPVDPPCVESLHSRAWEITVKDNDTGSVKVEPTALEVAAGETATYTVVLEAQPVSTVVLSVAGGESHVAAAESSRLEFTGANWNTPQTVTVRGVAPGEATLSHSASGSGYDAVAIDQVAVLVTAAPAGGAAGLTVSASCEPCEVAPGGTVVLNATSSSPSDQTLSYAWSAPEGRFVAPADQARVRWRAPADTGPVAILVEVSDGLGGSASAEVSVEVTNNPPAFKAPSYRFELRENEDGRVRPVPLGTVEAEDPDGDEVTYSLAAGDGALFAVGARDGVVTYVGPGEDFEKEPNRYELTVRASDPHRAEALAPVVVEVVDANDPAMVLASCEPCEVAPGDEVRLTASATDMDGGALRFAWSAPKGSFTAATDRATTRWRAPAETGPVAILVEVSDRLGGSASAEVSVEVTNAPPAFKAPSYSFELRENESGRVRPVPLGTVDAEDGEGDEVTYSMVSGDRERFAVGARDGVVTYVGPGENFETEPNRYELTVRASDPYGAEARAPVIVEVVDVNDPPRAVDDEAATNEDEVALIDLLANDTDPDGDALRVESVSAPAHGTARVEAGGGVAYTPEANYHGMDRFTYVVGDARGGFATAAVEVTVAPVNDSPTAVGTIPNQALDEGGSASELDVSPYFDDLDGDRLVYRASSSNRQVLMAAVSGPILTLTPGEYGSATVAVTAEDPEGLSAVQAFRVGVSDRPVRRVVRQTLAGMARSHLASVRMTLGPLVSTGGPDGGSRLTVLGRSVPLDKASARRASAPAQWPGSNVGAGRPGAPTAAQGGLGSLGGFGRPGSFGGMGGSSVTQGGMGSGLGGWRGRMGPLQGSQFLLRLGGDDTAGASEQGRIWRVWGQGDLQTFGGQPSAVAGYQGEVRTGYLGIDTSLSDRWLAGVAVSSSSGSGDWRTGGAQGSLATSLTTAYPYLRWSRGANSMWATLGGGWGTVENERATGRVGTSSLNLRLGLVELRRELGAVNGFALGLRADGAWAELRTGAGEETIDVQTAAVSQLRVGADVSRPVQFDSGLSVAPFGEVHVRHDGGAGQVGTGLEVVAGARIARGRLRLDAQGRLLVLHSAADYEERGVGVTLSFGNPGEEGPSLSMSLRRGNAAAGGGTLWREQVYRSHLSESMVEAWTRDVQGEHGIRLRSGRLFVWFGSLGQSAHGERFFLGVRLGSRSGRRAVSSGPLPVIP